MPGSRPLAAPPPSPSGRFDARAARERRQVASISGRERPRVVGASTVSRSSSEARRFANRPVRLPDGLYWDALGLFAELCTSLAELARRQRRVRSIGIDSWGCDFGLLDRDGALVSNPLHHRDGRGARRDGDGLRTGQRRRRSTRRPGSSSCRSTRSSS